MIQNTIIRVDTYQRYIYLWYECIYSIYIRDTSLPSQWLLSNDESYKIQIIFVQRLVFELPASGGVVPSSSFRAVHLYQYVVTDKISTLVAMIFFILFLIYYTLEEIFELLYFRKRYFVTFWNLVDFFIVVVSINLSRIVNYLPYDLLIWDRRETLSSRCYNLTIALNFLVSFKTKIFYSGCY